MKLIGSLCELINFEVTENGIEASVRLNSIHPIFAAHFPGHPVTPGVIQMQLVAELVGHHVGKSVSLIELDSCKFIKVLDPEKTPELFIDVNVEQEGERIVVTATGKTNEGTFLKLRGHYRTNPS